MVVVDTNIIAYLWIPGKHTVIAERLLQKEPNWIVPILWRSEFRNILASYIRKQLISIEHATQILEAAENHLKDCEYTVSTVHVMSLVNQSSCSAYDCEFVALAQDLKLPLCTFDKKILKEFPAVAYDVHDYIKNRGITSLTIQEDAPEYEISNG